MPGNGSTCTLMSYSQLATHRWPHCMPHVPTFRPFFAMASDPVGMHYIESVARSGGNVTGLGLFEPSLGGKWVELIKEVASNIQHIGIVYNPEPGNNSVVFRREIDVVANRVGISSIETPSGNSSNVDRLMRSFKGRLEWWPHFLAGRDHLCPTKSHYVIGCAVRTTGDLPVSRFLRDGRPYVRGTLNRRSARIGPP